jgi:hypothetical protein
MTPNCCLRILPLPYKVPCDCVLSRYSFPPLCLFLFVFGFVVKQAAKATGRDHCLDENDIV